MRFGTPNLKQVLLGAFDKRYLVDVFYDGVRVMQDVPVTNVQLTDSSTSLVQGSGSLSVVYQDDFAREVSPAAVGDIFSPFGTQVFVYAIVTAGPGFTERVLMGQYLVAETPSINTTRFLFQGATVSKGDVIGLTLKDLFAGVQFDKFPVPGAALSRASAWAEIQRLTGLPVTRSMIDVPILSTVTYQEDKLQPVYDLAKYCFDGVAYLTADGTVSVRPNDWPAAVDTIASGNEGTLVDAAYGMSADNVYNHLVVRSNDSGTSVLAAAEITDGPLRAQNTDGSLSPFRRRTMLFSSQYITTQGQARAYVNKYLPRVAQLRSTPLVLTEVFNPLRELGDVVTIARLGKTLTGRVTDIQRDSGVTQKTTVTVGQ